MDVRVQAGLENCVRCEEPIAPGEDWQLDHDDAPGAGYRGASHRSCNAAAGGAKSHLDAAEPRRRGDGYFEDTDGQIFIRDPHDSGTYTRVSRAW
jgi:hypothetical protein